MVVIEAEGNVVCARTTCGEYALGQQNPAWVVMDETERKSETSETAVAGLSTLRQWY